MGHAWEAKWKDVEKLGHGGQGVTRKVSAVDDQQPGVLKYLKNNRSKSARVRMRREIAALQELKVLGAKVPAVLDHNSEAFEDLSVELFLVMEYIEGNTLDATIRQHGSIGIDDTSKLVLALCDIVGTAHSVPILHRDIKPDNIIVRSLADADLWMVDYGLSFHAEDDGVTQADEPFRNRFLSLPETTVPGGDRRDKRSDVTALCAVFYFLLTGHYPGQLQDGSGRLPHMRPGFSIREAVSDQRVGQVEMLLNRGLAVPVELRFQTVAELAGRIRGLSVAPGESANPYAAAKEMAALLLKHDRTTQIAEFEKLGQRVIERFHSKLGECGGKIAPFSLGMHFLQIANAGTELLPIGYDCLGHVLFVEVSLETHKKALCRAYCIGSKGPQCALLAVDVSGRRRPERTSDWTEIAWFETVDNNLLADILREFEQWLERAMRAIAEPIIYDR